MIKSAMRTQTADFVGDKNITRYTSAQYDTALDRAQEQFALDTRALWEDVSWSHSASDADETLPMDFMWEDWVTYDGVELIPISRHELTQRYGEDWTTQTASAPTHYLIDPEEAVKEIVLFPIPTQAKTLIMRYFPLPASMSSDSSVALNSSALLAQFHIAICAYAAWLLLMGEDMTPAINQKMGQLQSIYAAGASKATDTFKNTAAAPIKIRGSRTWS